MAEIGEEIRTLLLSDAGILAAMGGSGFEYKINSDERRYDDPSIVYTVLSEQANEHLGGIVGLDRARVEIACYAANRTTANANWQLCRSLLTHYSGTPDSIFIKQISQASGHEYDLEKVDLGDKEYEYHFATVQDFFVFYETSL